MSRDQDPQAGLFVLQRHFARQLEPFQDLQKQLRSLAIPPMSSELQSFVEHIAKQNDRFRQAISTSAHELVLVIGRIGTKWRQLKQAGWLPHYTTPLKAVESVGSDIALISEVTSNHYCNHWPEVRVAFLARLSKYPIDDEAKATFKEALLAHENGLYRAACRLLFPEIERVARINLHHNNLEQGISGQRTLRSLAGDIGLSDVEPTGFYNVMLYEKLSNHLYSSAKTEEDVNKISLDPVPNRHASMHGLISYSTMQNSINMLIMADYIFQVICALTTDEGVKID